MTQQIVTAQSSIVVVHKKRSVALICRRLAAWGLEVGLVAVSALVPWGVGQYVLTASTSNISAVEETSAQDALGWVALSPLLNKAQQGWALAAQIPPHQLHRQVPQLTNILWTAALVAPIVAAGGQLVQLRVTGRTWPKKWLKIQVISMAGHLMFSQVLARELFRWALPLAVVGGFTMLTSISLGLWTPVLVVFLAMLEGVTGIRPDRRSWHDRIARTRVEIANNGYLPISGESLLYSLPLKNSPSSQGERSIQLYGETSDDEEWWLTEADGNLTSLVLPPVRNNGSLALPQRHPWFDRPWWLMAGCMVFTCLLGFGIGRVVQSSANIQTEEDAFLQITQTLMANVQSGGDYSAAILMLAQVDDPRTAQYLVDLLSQSSQPQALETIQQALVSQGLDSLPSLLSLSRLLEHDLRQSLDTDTRYIRLEQRHVVQGAIAKLLAIHSDELVGIRLDRVNLGRHYDSDRAFRLIQPGLLAAGSSWQGANLNQANLAGASFFDVGADGKADSYDDVISDLSGISLVAARLEQSNLQGAQLGKANLRRANLTDANLAYGNLERAQLTNARLMHVNAPQSRWQGSNLVGADLTQAIFDGADLSQARLNRIEAAHSSWIKATLPQSAWIGANLIGADFGQAKLTGADFQGAQLDSVDLTRTDLRQANFRDADLRQAKLTGANLTDADLANAIFDDGRPVTGSFITPNAQLSAANHLQGVNFSRVRNLDARQLNYICAQGGIHPTCQEVLDVE